MEKVIKIEEIWRTFIKQGLFTQNFGKQPYIFLLPKFLELFFTPKNTPPKPKNSKLDKSPIFLGHPVEDQKLENLSKNIISPFLDFII